MKLFRDHTERRASVDEVVSGWQTRPRSGQIVHFVGVVRGRPAIERCQYLEYEAIPRWQTHAWPESLTRCEPGGHRCVRWPSFTAPTSAHRPILLWSSPFSAHREQVFDALHYTIDRLKDIVPIWKKRCGQTERSGKVNDRKRRRVVPDVERRGSAGPRVERFPPPRGRASAYPGGAGASAGEDVYADIDIHALQFRPWTLCSGEQQEHQAPAPRTRGGLRVIANWLPLRDRLSSCARHAIAS